MARTRWSGRTAPGVLPGLTVAVTPAPPPAGFPLNGTAPVRAAEAGGSASGPGSRRRESDPTDLVLFGGLATLFAMGLAVREGVRLLQRPHPDAATIARGVDLVLLATVIPPAAVWAFYRLARPRTPASPWEGKALPSDRSSQAELMASPAATIAWAVGAVGSFVALVVLAVRVTVLAWIGVPVALVLSVLLVTLMLRPTVLVVNSRGFGVRSARRAQRLAVPWFDVAEVERGPGDVVRITSTAAPNGDPRPGLELRGSGSAGADQVAALLTSYLEAHSLPPAPQGP